MRHDADYAFDLSTPGRVQWAHCGRPSQVDIPKQPVRYTLNDDGIARAFSAAVDPLLADLLDVAVGVHMADRLAVRSHANLQETMPSPRRLALKIGVRCPDSWKRPRVKGALIELLQFLTLDSWDLRFVKLGARRGSETQQYLFDPDLPPNPDVGLFSGGLDSLAGTAIQFAEDRRRHFVCVSASPNNIQKAYQQRQFKHLCGYFDRQATHVSIGYSMRDGDRLLQEPSRRTRGFAFLVLGVVVALSAHTDCLYVYENGVGAINLPYDLSQVGIDNTRAMHPQTLRSVASLVSFLAGRPFRVENRSLFLTKAELCGHPAFRAVASLIPASYSCDGVTRKGEHCGFCTSCLLRRLAITSAGLSRYDRTRYLNDCCSLNWNPKRRQLRGLCAMTWQASRLKRSLTGVSRWERMVLEFPELQAVLAELSIENGGVKVTQQLVRLYEQHVCEWFRFPALMHVPMQIAA